MAENPLRKLESFGQSIWTDFIRRSSTQSGELGHWIEQDGVTGVTSNPSIFEKAIAGSHDYDETIRAQALAGKSPDDIFLNLVIEDIQQATDLFRPVYDRTNGADGYVSIEVSPNLARNTEGTINEARKLWKMVDRPNVMVKVPGTLEGLPAIRQLTSEGININITLLFGLPRYREVTEAYIAGLEDWVKKGNSPEKIASVASFFLSRIDTLVDPMLEKIMAEGGQRAETAKRVHGQVAIASARVAYQMYKAIFQGERFQALTRQGAHTQRLLWASTSTKNPEYSDVKYVEALIGPDTVNTLPVETLDAYRDHGKPAPRLEENVEQARQVLAGLGELGIQLDEITQQLENEGVQKFEKAFAQLSKSLNDSLEAALKEPVDRQVFQLGQYDSKVRQRIDELGRQNFTQKLWQKDASLWKSDPKSQEVIHNALGWLHVAEKMEECLDSLVDFAGEIKNAGFKHALHMGMGGSSLAPYVFIETFPTSEKGIPVTVLDTTDPEKILEIERSLPIEDTLFIVASKSGTTAEPEAFMRYFYDKVKAKRGDQAGQNFVAITDPGTKLVKQAQEMGFRKVFLNFADIGGRYSALSYFGLVPAALMGMEVGELLVRALRMEHACSACVPVQENPGLTLGAAMGELALAGAYQVTFITPKKLDTLGLWLEQLLAESTGKEGKGLLPVANEPLGDSSDYGHDRLFVYFKLNSQPDPALDARVAALQQAGQPVITIQMEDPLDIGQEFMRWEIATVTAGAVLGINPLDQPNVQESKDNTNRLLDQVRQSGQLPEQKPTLTDGALSFYANQSAGSAVDLLRDFFAQAKAGDFVSLQGYIEETPENTQAFQRMREHILDQLHLTTTFGYGPRFLHSTGQFHKGGPNTGLFLQVVDEDPNPLPIPGQDYGFATFKQAQALGDLQALRQHGRRVISVHLAQSGSDGARSGAADRSGLEALARLIDQAVSRVKA